jgi:uncharacterized membrane protein (DUF485 family)
MKKIALWKVIVLSIVTLGIYSVVWLARRRNELVNNYQQKVPSWLWLVIPSAISIGVIVPTVILTFILIPNNQLMQILIIMGVLSILMLISGIIYLWWVWLFSAAMARVIENRVPTGWAFVIYLFLGAVLTYVHQFYINRYATDKLSEKNVGPSTKFIVLTIVAIVASFVLSGVYSASIPNDFQKLQEESTVQQNTANDDAELKQKAERLLGEYNTCIGTLQENYPDVTEENEAAYTEAYNNCDTIRAEQNEAAAQYNKN